MHINIYGTTWAARWTTDSTKIDQNWWTSIGTRFGHSSWSRPRKLDIQLSIVFKVFKKKMSPASRLSPRPKQNELKINQIIPKCSKLNTDIVILISILRFINLLKPFIFRHISNWTSIDCDNMYATISMRSTRRVRLWTDLQHQKHFVTHGIRMLLTADRNSHAQ